MIIYHRLWSAYTTVESPLSVVSAHEKFIEAGSDIIISSSYQMSYEGFQEKGYGSDQTDVFFRRATACALAATNNMSFLRSALVVASVGCYGAHLADGSEYGGDYGLSVAELELWHRPKFNVLCHSGADAIACETIPCLAECRALRNLIASQISDRRTNSGRGDYEPLSGWLSCSCKSGTALNSGEDFEDALRIISDPPCELESEELSRWGVGVNCTDPQYVCELLDIVRDLGSHSRPVVMYPNKGNNASHSVSVLATRDHVVR
jgi:homocysteine S-methyltransferase